MVATKGQTLLCLLHSEGFPESLESLSSGRRTEQAKANLDPRVGPRVAPRVGPQVAPRVCPREHPRGLISLFSAFKDSPRNLPRRCPRKGPRVDGRGSPVLFSPGLFFDQVPLKARNIRKKEQWAIPPFLEGRPSKKGGRGNTLFVQNTADPPFWSPCF